MYIFWNSRTTQPTSAILATSNNAYNITTPVSSHQLNHFSRQKLKSYIAVEAENLAINLEKYFKSGSGKTLAQKRLW